MKSSEMYTPAQAAVIAGGPTALLNELEIDSCYCNEGVEVGEDEWLVQGCIRGDQQAWEALIDKYKRLIFSIPIKYGASSTDAADVFQARMYRGIEQPSSIEERAIAAVMAHYGHDSPGLPLEKEAGQPC